MARITGNGSDIYTMNGSERLAVTKNTGDAEDETAHVYVTDSHGNVRGLTDSAGNITDSYSYDAYGSILKASGSTENEFLYTGEQYSAASGLYYLRARYMNPDTGTFTGLDSYQGDIYDPLSLHKYLYANASPVMNTDPTGHMIAALTCQMAMQSTIDSVEAAYNAMVIRTGMKIITALTAYKVLSSANQTAVELQWSLATGDVSLISGFASYVNGKILENVLPLIAFITVTGEMKAVQTYVESLKVQGKYEDYSVYLLKDHDSKKVMYVGITSQKPDKRNGQHQNNNLPVNQRHPKNTNGVPWDMQVIFTGLTKEEARAMEQSLICIYTINALSNARYEIAKKNIAGFESEISRAASLLKIDESGLFNLVKRKEWNGE